MTAFRAGGDAFEGVIPATESLGVHCIVPGFSLKAPPWRDFGEGRFPGIDRPKQVLVTPPVAEAKWFWGEPLCTLNLAMPVGALEPVAEEVGLNRPVDLSLAATRPREEWVVANLLERIWFGLDPARPAPRLHVDHLFGLVARWLIRQTGFPVRKFTGGLTPRGLRLVLAFLHEHLAENISGVELAALVHLSPAHFNRAFNRSVGEPPHRHLLRLRCERVKAMMLMGAPLAEVGVAVGFADQSHFTKAFRSLNGATPAYWLRQMRD